jgi:hypothetical protein
VLFNTADNGLAHGEVTINLIRLVEHAQGDASATGNAARVWLKAASKNLHQRGLAITITTYNTNAVTVIDTNGDAVKDDARGEFKMEVLSTE